MRQPIERSYCSENAAAGGADRAAVLLGRVDPVRKLVIDGDVIDLRRWLVVPRAPIEPAVLRNRRALVSAEEYSISVGWIKPHLLGIISARCTLESGERFAAVERAIAAGADDVNGVRIFWVDVNAAVVSALTIGHSSIGGIHLPPRIAAVVRPV